MTRTRARLQVILLVSSLVTAPFAVGANAHAAKPTRPMKGAVPVPQQGFTDAELDELLAPIALYPDPLLAQVVPASTFIDQLEDAQSVLRGKSDDNLIANQSWDVSVKSVAHYPQVLQMMVDKRDWTTALGQAYVNQSTDVGKAIQRLRAEAKAAGSLVTTAQQEVISEGQVIRIEPAQPQVIYVPQYNPEVVYVDSGPSTGAVVAAAAISFGVGLAIGAWLNNDWDYYGRGIYYHGWVGGGWVGVNRSFVNVNVNRNIYVNNRYNRVNVNRNITNRNISSYRNTLNRNATVRRDRVNNANLRNTANRSNNIGNRPNVNANDRVNRASASRTDALNNRDQNRGQFDSLRSRETQPKRDSNSAFGGGGNRSQTKQESNRGGQSIQKMNTDRSSGRFGGGGARGGGGGRRGRG